MAQNLITLFEQFGQSAWYDNIRRGDLESGAFKKLVDSGIRGCTSNPTIFDKAIGGSSDYDEALERLTSEGASVDEIYYDLVVHDIRQAADTLHGIYESSSYVDGYISVEVQPHYATNTKETVAEAERLVKAISRENLLIKVPATPEGLPAITELIGQGISVNVTLIFSVEQYRKVAEAYLAGLEIARERGLDLLKIASVASFFVSRIDGAADKKLSAKMAEASGAERDKIKNLLGKAAIANAKQAYVAFEEIFGSERFAKLRQAGARAQRVLWASTSTKNPDYPDTLYVDELIGPNTVNTMPPQTVEAFKDHGKLEKTLTEGQADADRVVAELEQVGVPLGPICDELLEKGVRSFADSMDSLMSVIASRREALIEKTGGRQSFSLGKAAEPVVSALSELEGKNAAQRLWKKDRSLFTDDPKHDESVATRLGWLASPAWVKEQATSLTAFAREAAGAGFKKALLLGMGGSSLCPEVLALTYGARPGALELHVLDSTDPDAVRAAEQWADLDSTLFVVASKSGSTIEVRSFEAYFWAKAQAKFGDRAGERFIAITDPGSPLSKSSKEKGYRHVFENPADIGGRYSALSLFGLVPAALLGIDIDALLDDALRMKKSCGPEVPMKDNPGVRLGAFIGGLARTGRDKMTLIASKEVENLGSWIEQLVAESTGKEGRGILPVDREPVGAPSDYGEDRSFVYVRFGGANKTELDAKVDALVAAGQPVATVRLLDRKDLGGEFFRWEVATSVASALLGINPFDEPNVKEAKTETGQIIAQFEAEGELGRERGLAPDDEKIIATLKQAQRGDYVTFSAFFRHSEEADRRFAKLRQTIREKLGVASTQGYGPRFLHSTGQLHKGGGNNGVFLVLTADCTADLEIPGEKYSFGVLRDAQGMGDAQVLARRERRLVRVHLGSDPEAGLDKLQATLSRL